MKSLNIKQWLNKLLNRPDLERAAEDLKAENDPYQRAKAELEQELAQLEEKSKELDKQLVISMHKLKQVDNLYKKVSNGEALNDLEANQLQLIRL